MVTIRTAHLAYTKSWIPVGKICNNWELGFADILVSRASELVLFSIACSDKVLKITLCGKVQLELHCKDFLGKAVTAMFLLSNFEKKFSLFFMHTERRQTSEHKK